ncbi:flagellin [Methylobacterium gregans]|uniref:Flagellin n=1 Tax=Methylobacterium gregans TaxID=374424 RepID=A0AA37HR93_9HYPH|nr:flagellin [Methylobacterium gregans]MDQ0521836.1 hypothetical protein [Methylobacterium gregans]GJD79498.1 hypothetical protein NBEOAGPD_2725 [Methylobacterium gregans]GLS52097.1 hypothetical protein GCM10007886_02790 [Methylobacterium gregans]
MSSITLSAATRQNLLSLQDTASLLSTTQSRLSTGKKVNSALDNPTNFFTSQSLTARSSDLSNLLDGISNGVQVIQAANQGITSITKLIDTAKSTAQQALADKTGGSTGATGGAKAQAAKVIGTATLAGLGTTDASGRTTFDLSSAAKDASLDISLDGGATKTTIRLDATTLASSGTDLTKVTSDQLLTAISGQIGNNAALKDKVTASFSADGRLSFTTTAAGASAKLTVAGSANSTIDIGYGKATVAPTPSTVTANGALGAATDFSTGSASLVVSDGNTSVNIRLDKNAVTDASGGTLGTSASRQQVLDAINKQLKDNGSTVTVAANADNKLVFSSADVGPDAQISVIGGLDTTGGSGIGFSSFTAGATTPGALAANTLTTSAATYTAPVTAAGGGILPANIVTGNTAASRAGSTTSSVTSGPNIDLRDGKTATFSVTNGAGVSRSVTLNENTFSGAATPGNPTQAELKAAINAQLSGFDVQADFAANKLTFTNTATGDGKNATVSASYDTIGLGFQTGGTSSLNGTPPTTIVPGQSTTFTVNDGAKTTTVSLDSTSLMLDNNAIGTASTAAEFVSAINRQLRDDNNGVTASVVGGKLTFTTNAVGAGHAAPTVTQGTDAIGLFGVPATTKSSAAATFPSTADLTTASAGFTVDGTTITLDKNSQDKDGVAIGTNPTAAKMLESINRQLGGQPATRNVTAYLDGAGKLTFARQGTAAGAVAAPVVASASDTIGLGLGTANALTATGTVSTPATSSAARVQGGAATAPFALTATANTFQVGDGTATANVSISAGTAKVGGGTLGATPSQTEVAAAIQAQLDAQGVNVTASFQGGKLTFDSQGVGASASVTLTPGHDEAAGAGLGLGSAGVANPPTTAHGVSAGSIDLSGGKSSAFAISDGSTSKNVTISATSLDRGGNQIGTSATQAKVAEAIQVQLDTGNVKASVAFVGNQLKITGNAVGTGAGSPTLTVTRDTAGLGLGTTTTTNSTPHAGGGTAAAGVTSSGTEATDGSSKASIVGTEQTVTKDFSGTKDASFTLKLGSGPLKLITLNSSNLGTSPNTSQSAIAKAINDQIAADTGLAGKVSASYVNNKLVLTTTDSGSDQKLTVTAAQVTTGGTTGLDIGFGVSGSGATAQTASGTDVGGSKGVSSVRSTLATQFNQILQQITQQAQDSGYNGLNLLFRNSNSAADNTLHIAFNEKNTAALDIGGVKFDAAGLGLDTITGGFQTDTEITAAIEKLTSATSQLRTQSSTFGANLSVVQNRQDFSKAMINILDTGAGNLVNADLNEEAANSQALSTRNSLAVSALSLANQAQQGILQLLR